MMKKQVKLSDSSVANYWRRIKKYNLFYFLKVYSLKYIPICFFLFSGVSFGSALFSLLWWFFVTMFFDHRHIFCFNPVVRVWFGVPGSGKTSLGALLARNSQRQNINVLSNVEIRDTYKLDIEDLGSVDMSFNGHGCHVVIDEASIDFDNRNYSNFVKTNKPKYFALHRHMQNMVDVFSQGYDIDKRIRDRTSSSGLFHLKKFPIPGFVFVRQIKKVLFIKKDDKQLIDGFEYCGLPRFIYSRSVWHSFNTLDTSLCPKAKKEWVKWGETKVSELEQN